MQKAKEVFKGDSIFTSFWHSKHG